MYILKNDTSKYFRKLPNAGWCLELKHGIGMYAP